MSRRRRQHLALHVIATVGLFASRPTSFRSLGKGTERKTCGKSVVPSSFGHFQGQFSPPRVTTFGIGSEGRKEGRKKKEGKKRPADLFIITAIDRGEGIIWQGEGGGPLLASFVRCQFLSRHFISQDNQVSCRFCLCLPLGKSGA